MPPAPGRFIQTGDIQTHYIEAGDGDPLILVHGGGAGADGCSNWQASLPLFSEHYRTFVVDMVGFGYSAKPDPEDFTYDQDARTRQLIAFIEAMGLDRVSLIGNSMGGATSLGVAMRRPDLVEKLVLMGSAGYSNEVSPELSTILHYDFTREGMRDVVAALTDVTYEPTDAQVEYRYQMSMDPATKAAYGATMDWVREVGMAYSAEQISSVKTRTLVVNGKSDLVCPVRFAYGFLDLLENSTGYILPHCGHWAMLEHPDEFARVTLDFLANSAPSPVAA